MPDDKTVSVPVHAKQSGKDYNLYFNGDSDEDIAKDFKERHGYYPDVIIQKGGGKLAGPLREGDGA